MAEPEIEEVALEEGSQVMEMADVTELATSFELGMKVLQSTKKAKSNAVFKSIPKRW